MKKARKHVAWEVHPQVKAWTAAFPMETCLRGMREAIRARNAEQFEVYSTLLKRADEQFLQLDVKPWYIDVETWRYAPEGVVGVVADTFYGSVVVDGREVWEFWHAYNKPTKHVYTNTNGVILMSNERSQEFPLGVHWWQNTLIDPNKPVLEERSWSSRRRRVSRSVSKPHESLRDMALYVDEPDGASHDVNIAGFARDARYVAAKLTRSKTRLDFWRMALEAIRACHKTYCETFALECANLLDKKQRGKVAAKVITQKLRD